MQYLCIPFMLSNYNKIQLFVAKHFLVGYIGWQYSLPLEKNSAVPLSPICLSSHHISRQTGRGDFAYLWRPNYDQPVVQLALSCWI